MRWLGPLVLFCLVISIATPAQQSPDLGPVLEPLDELAGQTIPPTLNTTWELLGQNITREDVRLYLDVNITKGDVGLLGLLIGSGRIEVQADVRLRAEMRVISSDRIRAVIEGENAYNISAENATFLSQVYIPAEVFRATATAEIVALFKDDQEAALVEYLTEAAPELKVLGLEFAWDNIHPYEALTDLSLTEPPIVLEIRASLQYIRTESIPSLLDQYLRSKASNSDDARSEGEKEYIDDLKRESSEDRSSRDFFAGAAYDQLLNLSMQPGWSLQVDIRVPRGFSIEYVNENIERHGPRHITFTVEGDDEDQVVLLASIKHRRAIALALFGAMWIVGGLLALPGRLVYYRKRVLQNGAKTADDA